MSRVGKLPIEVPAGVKTTLTDNILSIKGPKGAELNRSIPPEVTLTIEKDIVIVTPMDDSRRSREMHGLVRTLINNMVIGVTTGFVRELDIIGVGYRVELQGDYLLLNLGYSHPILYELPPSVSAEVDTKANRIKLNSVDKESIGQAAATIRAFRPPEPYKGKGIRYRGETVRRKVGKAGAVA